MAGLPDLTLAAMYENGSSLPELERITGIPRSTVRYRLVRAGVALRARADAVRKSPGLGSGRRGKVFHFTADHRAAISQARNAWAEENAAGKTKRADGYVEITRGEHKGRSEHVIIMEQRLGRKIKVDEVVHHIDGDRGNNHPDNLALMTRAAHTRLHRREQRISKGTNNGRP